MAQTNGAVPDMTGPAPLRPPQANARRKQTVGPSADALAMNLGELLELAEAAPAWGLMIEKLTHDRDEWKRRALEAERQSRRYVGIFERAGFVQRDTDDKETEQL